MNSRHVVGMGRYAGLSCTLLTVSKAPAFHLQWSDFQYHGLVCQSPYVWVSSLCSASKVSADAKSAFF